MFQAVKEFRSQLNPSSASIAFVQVAIEAVWSTFPNCSIHGCLFHLTKRMCKKQADEDLHRRYNMEPNFALAARLIFALSFVPIDDLDVALEALRNYITEDLKPIFNWLRTST
ncbi:hypothetical protein ACJMK2_023479 [Sinanodonta woodiana]|uniref:MULE transposase domain-containing protein n=1 Tax=Sinanodonta woodiana TaxID=1069815 RepID=A0ABD3T5Y8_SINWO